MFRTFKHLPDPRSYLRERHAEETREEQAWGRTKKLAPWLFAGATLVVVLLLALFGRG